MLQVFGMASSNAAIIVNMDACENKLGISKKIYSLSIPLGATVNMDGTCIYLVIFGMALARVFGVDINGGMMLSMFFSVFVLSVGAPGVPGAGLVCLSVLLTQLNVPLAGIGLLNHVSVIFKFLICIQFVCVICNHDKSSCYFLLLFILTNITLPHHTIRLQHLPIRMEHSLGAEISPADPAAAGVRLVEWAEHVSWTS